MKFSSFILVSALSVRLFMIGRVGLCLDEVYKSYSVEKARAYRYWKQLSREDDTSKCAMLEAMSVSFTYGFVTNILGVLKFFEDYIPCFRNYAHDCLIEKGTFESLIPLHDIYYEE